MATHSHDNPSLDNRIPQHIIQQPVIKPHNLKSDFSPLVLQKSYSKLCVYIQQGEYYSNKTPIVTSNML